MEHLGVSGRGEFSNGEYKRRVVNPVVFIGRTRVEAKKRALDYWYREPRLTGLTLRDFLRRCRIKSDDREIAFYPQELLV